MDVDKLLLRQFVTVIAINAGLMSEDLAGKINNFDADAYRTLLEVRLKQLIDDSRRADSFFPPTYYTEGARIISEVLERLDKIL